jgi:ATP-dependent exoDNAse (exonuclease V) beta subunit
MLTTDLLALSLRGRRPRQLGTILRRREIFHEDPLESTFRSRRAVVSIVSRIFRNVTVLQYDEAKEATVIELTEQQMQALEKPEASPPQIVNPRTKETFVLLRVDEYARLKEDEYDDSPWTREELNALAWETAKHAEWDDIDEYDDAPEQP